MSINCWEVDIFSDNKSFQDLKLVAIEAPSVPSNSKLGAANVLTGSPICLGTIETESITGTKISSEIQILDFSPNLEGSGS